jgi:hypothetical protein
MFRLIHTRPDDVVAARYADEQT